MPNTGKRGEPIIDYLGAGLIAAGLSAIVLVTSLGGNTWAWDSAQVVINGALGLVLLAAFYYGDVVEVLDRLARDLAAGRPRELARG